MLAKSSAADPDWSLCRSRPKWDGFRSIVFRDGGDEVEIGSRDERPMTSLLLRDRGRIKINSREVRSRWRDHRCSRRPAGVRGVAEQRIHPAASRVRPLPRKRPARFHCVRSARRFGRHRLHRSQPFEGVSLPLNRLWRTPTADPSHPGHLAITILPCSGSSRFEGAGLDGVVAKPLLAP